jgi:hypothetical protein
MDESTMQTGLLMEAAQAQQKAVEALMHRLAEAVTGLDGVIRDELRRAFVEEFRALSATSQAAADSLSQVRRAAGRRMAMWAIAVSVASAAAPCLLSWAVLPSRAEVASLRAQRNELVEGIAELERRAGHIDLRRCGESARLCVRVERSAPVYGTDGDYRIIKGS